MNKIFDRIVRVLTTLALLATSFLPLLRPLPAYASTTWNIGDVYAAVGGGNYNVYDNSGAFKETVSDGLGGTFTTGCAFNPSLTRLYVTDFSNTKVVALDDASPHAVVNTIDSGAISPGGHSESAVFAANGHYFVGHPDGNDLIHEYDALDNLVTTYAAAVDNRGTDWIDLSSNQTTLFYTSEGRAIQRYDIVGGQMADFAALPGAGNAFALRLLPPGDGTGGLLVADNSNVKQLDLAGNVISTYDVTGVNGWFSLNLDPDGMHFWAGSSNNGTFYKFLIQPVAGNYVDTQLTTVATGSNNFFGLCLKGEPTAALPEISLDPKTATNSAGENHTVTATVKEGGNPLVGTLVSFSVTAGPNTGEVSDPGECLADPNCNTDASGQTSWTYTSDGTTGTDVIEACFTDKTGKEHCARAQKEWVDRTPPQASCVETVNPHGKTVPPAGKTTLPGPKGGDNEDGFYELLAKDLSGIVSLVISDAFGSGPFAVSPGDKVKITQAPDAVPVSKPMGSGTGQAGAIATHIILNGDAILTATDGAGNVTTVTCLVPPPPK